MSYARMLTLALSALTLAGCEVSTGNPQDSADPVQVPVPSNESAALPSDVAAFVERREGCDHFRGEEAYDKEREAFLLKSMKETCTGTDAELARLRRVHADDPVVMTALADFEDSIEYTAEETP
ncbi:MAG: hypothetical protein P8J20_06060 [Novosphingobium sp.]|nr:hypothetical protein [Novosphingobium sp.]